MAGPSGSHRQRVCRRLAVRCTLVLAVSVGAATLAAPASPTDDPAVTVGDPACDPVARRTDPSGDGPFDPAAHRLVNLLEYTVGRWAPTAPASDLFTGAYDLTGEFARLDLVLDGLNNPPGSVDPQDFTPFAFGDHPVFGFVEIDMDDDNDTGGELDAPQYRYLGNIVRFGGQAHGDEFADRIALDGTAFDGGFATAPYVERHGEEFHLSLLGDDLGIGDVTEIAGDGDALFEAGEVWDIRSQWFHRAHGFEPFSVAKGSTVPGEYAPVSEVRFRHHTGSDTTRVTMVFPLTNVGAGLMRGEPAEPLNHDPSDHASILEALNDLVVSAILVDMFPTGLPEEAIILDWKDKDPDSYLDPTHWRVTVLLGSSYTAPDPTGEYFVWTDAYPNVEPGDVDGDNEGDGDDRQFINDYIAEYDALDGVVDGSVTISGFAANFSVFDVNHDGLVDSTDVALVGESNCEVIPTVSQWGVAMMVLLLATAGTIVFGRVRSACVAR